MKNILYLISSLSKTGPVIVLYNTVRYLDRNEFNPIIITFSPEKEDSMLTDFEELDIRVIKLNFSRYEIFTKGLTILKNQIKELKIDLIQANCFRSTITAKLISKKIPKITIAHNFPHEDYPLRYGVFTGKIMSFISLFLYRRFEKLVTVSSTLAKGFKELYQLDSIPINNGVNLEEIKTICRMNKEDLKKEFKITQQGKIFLYLDVMRPIKDPETIIKAFLKAFGNDRKNLLLLVGSGNLLEELKEKYQSRQNIIFYGYSPEPFKFFRLADFYLTASLSESFHLSVLESLLIGTPVILSDIEAHKYFHAINNDACNLFKTQDIEELSKIILNSLDKKFTFPLLSEEAIIKYKLSAELMSLEYQKLYFELLRAF